MAAPSKRLAKSWLAAQPRSLAQAQMKANALAWLAEVTIAQASPSGCFPGDCRCPSRDPRCRMWVTLERLVRERWGISEPAPTTSHGGSKVTALRELHRAHND